eukprot:scaffold113610_cov88-Phaeocystis_antarctica.AAC.1
MAWSVVWLAPSQGKTLESKCDAASLSQRHAHRDERITAARLDRDATRGMEPGTAAGAVEVAKGAAAGERGGRPTGDFDTADTLVVTVLRCIM